jgi:hypothetical protein
MICHIGRVTKYFKSNFAGPQLDIRIKAWHCCALVAHSNTEVRQLVAAVIRQAITYGVTGSLQLKRPSDRSVIGALLSDSREPWNKFTSLSIICYYDSQFAGRTCTKSTI